MPRVPADDRRWVVGLLALTMAIAACGSDSSTPSGSPGSSSSPTPSSSVASTAASLPSPSRFTPRDLAVRPLLGLGDALRGTAISALAGGSNGYVLVGKDRRSGGLLSWTSVDGMTWERHWLPGTTFGGGTPSLVVAAPFGYLALGWAPELGSPARRPWSSPDGVSWQPLATGELPVGDVTAMAGGPWGAAVVVDGGVANTAVVATVDGRTWQVADLPGQPLSSAVSLIQVPHGILVFGWSLPPTQSGDSDPSAWQSSDGHSWTAEPGIAAAIGHRDNSIDFWQMSPWGAVGIGIGPNDLGQVVGDDYAAFPAPPAESGRLLGGPAGLVWVGAVNRAATCVTAWQYDGAAWQVLAGNRATPTCSAAEGEATFTVASAASANSILVVGADASAQELVGWLVVPAEAQIAEAIEAAGAAPAGAIPDPLAGSIDRPSSCPRVPTTIAALQDVDRQTAVACFGDQAISFRAWIVDPGEGYGGACATFTPVWIHECVLPDYLLASSSSSTPNPQAAFHAMRSPYATGATKGVARWVNIVGHFNDAVAPSCRGNGETGNVGLESLLPPAVAVMRCRQVFVVTDVRTTT